MKLLYFLQELKGVPLGYDFRLHTYGPFDSDVLSDLATATAQNVVKESTVLFAKGYGYDITPGPHAGRLSDELASSNPQLAQAVDDLVATFGSFSAAELELRSTVLYVDREFGRLGTQSTTTAITDRVRQIKPYFTEEVISDRVNDFCKQKWLRSVSNP
jgi:hypothetical protein